MRARKKSEGRSSCLNSCYHLPQVSLHVQELRVTQGVRKE